MRIAVCLALLLPGMAAAEGFCNVTDAAEVFARIEGAWLRRGSLSIESATDSQLMASQVYKLTLDGAGMAESSFLDGVLGAPQQMMLADPRPYDVDRVDDVLDTTERPDIADTLSDTLCGPEALPQLVIPVAMAFGGTKIDGQVTLIPYFDDRILEITEYMATLDEGVLHVTETVLLRPWPKR
ncbi:hypothetical protein [Tropicibacter sp. S64]|uniref:hypothetical protein n=1 Tax=Tropicibacter sp. S64 TaxID=3415122 RepID=UPI003C7BA14F